jgi:hypothetical protein
VPANGSDLVSDISFFLESGRITVPVPSEYKGIVRSETNNTGINMEMKGRIKIIAKVKILCSMHIA